MLRHPAVVAVQGWPPGCLSAVHGDIDKQQPPKTATHSAGRHIATTADTGSRCLSQTKLFQLFRRMLKTHTHTKTLDTVVPSKIQCRQYIHVECTGMCRADAPEMAGARFINYLRYTTYAVTHCDTHTTAIARNHDQQPSIP